MRYDPNDLDLDLVLEETIYDEVESYYEDDLMDLVQSTDWN